MKILIVDDERSARLILGRILRTLPDVELVEASSLEEARQALGAHGIDLALVDLRLGPSSANRDGLTLLQEIGALDTTERRIRAVVVSAFTEGEEIVQAMRHADDYIFKHKLCEEMVLPIVERMREHQYLEREVRSLRARVATDAPPALVGSSPAMERLRYAIGRVALHSDRPVLVTGPTGSGKELVVTAIHQQGSHPDEPLLDLNCGAIPEGLIESQLFGHEKGAFTGADRKQEGYFTVVRQGTLFLDEIAELPMALQAKLLRVLESGRFRSVGSTQELRFQGRVVVATHADLAERVQQNRFREDLFYRLNVLQIAVPSLEERREDISALVAHFARRQARPLRFTADAIELLQHAAWPGNVRQLRNLIDRLAVFSPPGEAVTAEAIRRLVEPPVAPSGEPGPSTIEGYARAILRLPDDNNKFDAIEAALVAAAMELADGNKSAAARLLGCHRKAVERRLEKHTEE